MKAARRYAQFDNELDGGESTIPNWALPERSSQSGWCMRANLPVIAALVIGLLLGLAGGQMSVTVGEHSALATDAASPPALTPALRSSLPQSSPPSTPPSTLPCTLPSTPPLSTALVPPLPPQTLRPPSLPIPDHGRPTDGLPAIRNSGTAGCLDRCSRTAGYCPHFCGAEGACCHPTNHEFDDSSGVCNTAGIDYTCSESHCCTRVPPNGLPEQRPVPTSARTCEAYKRDNPNALVVSFVVPVVPGDFTPRQYIRETWISDALNISHRSTFCENINSSPQPEERPVCIDYRFIIGMSQASGNMAQASSLWTDLLNEMRAHQDIAVVPIEEYVRVAGDQAALAPKSAAVLLWAIRERAYADYVVHADSDTYVYAPRFVQHLPMLQRPDELVVVGRAHPVLQFRDSFNADGGRFTCDGGEVYGFSREMLRVMASPGYGTSESSLLNGLLHPGSAWGVGDPNFERDNEDAFVCVLMDHAMARNPGRQLNYRLVDAPDIRGIWIHKVKDEDEYRRCHSGAVCIGERREYSSAHTSFYRPAAFDPNVCVQCDDCAVDQYRAG